MTYFTVCCGYASHYHNIVTVDADSLDEALEKAIEQAGDDPHWEVRRPGQSNIRRGPGRG